MDDIAEKRPFFEHLEELRRRLIFCVVAVLIGAIVGYCSYHSVILDFLRGPLDALRGTGDNPFAAGNPFPAIFKFASAVPDNLNLDLHYTGPLEGFLVKLKASFFAGIIIAFPIILYQAWRFVSAGLKKNERRLIAVYFPVSLLLFAVGIAFAYFIMLPAALYFLIVVASSGLKPVLVISRYVSLVIVLSLALGVIFEIPLVVLFLSRIGLVTPALMRRNRKYAILLIFISAAVLTPPDIVTQFMLAVPIILLYEVSILVSKAAALERVESKKNRIKN